MIICLGPVCFPCWHLIPVLFLLWARFKVWYCSGLVCLFVASGSLVRGGDQGALASFLRADVMFYALI